VLGFKTRNNRTSINIKRNMSKRINETTMLKSTKVTETTGDCRNWKRCRSFSVLLGNGLCMECWDKNLTGRFYKKKRKQTIEKTPVSKIIRLGEGNLYQI